MVETAPFSNSFMQGSNPCPLAYKFGEGMVDRGRKISESEGRYHNAMRYLVYLTLPLKTTGGRYGAEKDYKGNRTACNLDDLTLPPTNSTTGGVCEVETDGGCCVHLKPDAALQNNGWRDE